MVKKKSRSLSVFRAGAIMQKHIVNKIKAIRDFIIPIRYMCTRYLILKNVCRGISEWMKEFEKLLLCRNKICNEYFLLSK